MFYDRANRPQNLDVEPIKEIGKQIRKAGASYTVKSDKLSRR